MTHYDDVYTTTTNKVEKTFACNLQYIVPSLQRQQEVKDFGLAFTGHGRPIFKFEMRHHVSPQKASLTMDGDSHDAAAGQFFNHRAKNGSSEIIFAYMWKSVPKSPPKKQK